MKSHWLHFFSYHHPFFPFRNGMTLPSRRLHSLSCFRLSLRFHHTHNYCWCFRDFLFLAPNWIYDDENCKLFKLQCQMWCDVWHAIFKYFGVLIGFHDGCSSHSARIFDFQNDTKPQCSTSTNEYFRPSASKQRENHFNFMQINIRLLYSYPNGNLEHKSFFSRAWTHPNSGW